MKKIAIGRYISMIALNVNELNAPSKRHNWLNGYKNNNNNNNIYVLSIGNPLHT